MDKKINWINLHLRPGSVIYLVDLLPDMSVDHGLKRLDLKCMIIDLRLGEPIWLQLKLIEPVYYPYEELGLLVDELYEEEDGDYIKTSLRDIDSLIRHIYMTEPTEHISPQSLKLSKLVSDEIWFNLFSRCEYCPKGRSCFDEDILHIAKYRHI